MTAFNKSKRAQAAMEFLMTYGWAILVVLIVIGALAYFGVLSPSTLLPEKCTFPVSLSCTDFSVAPSAITIMLQNGAGRDMTVRGVTATGDALPISGMCATKASSTFLVTDYCPLSAAPPANGCSFGGAAAATLRNGASGTITVATAIPVGSGCTFTPTGRDKNRYNITVFYSWVDSPTIIHQSPGELLARGPN